MVAGWVLCGLVMLPITFMNGEATSFTWEWLPFVLASGAVHAVYVCLLGWGYTVGDISVVFPISRGLGIVGTTVATLTLGLGVISFFGLFGIGTVMAGTLLIGLKEVPEQERRKAFFIAILVGLKVSTYSIVDSLGAKVVPGFFYVTTMYLLGPLFAAPFLVAKMRQDFVSVLKDHKLEAFWVAGAGALAYMIILWAYQKTTVAYIAALREFSIVIATLLGVFILKERLYARKVAGVVLILIGIFCVKAA